MAKVLIATLSIDGHVNPIIPVSRRLVDQGHEVRWYGGSGHQSKIEETGATYSPIKEALDFTQVRPQSRFPDGIAKEGIEGAKLYLKHVFFEPGIAQYSDIKEIVDEFEPDVIISETLFTGISMFAKEKLPPTISIGMIPMPTESVDTAPHAIGVPPIPGPANRIRNKIMRNVFLNKMKDVADFVNGLRTEMEMSTFGKKDNFFASLPLSFDRFLQATIPEFEYPRSDLPENVRFVGPIIPKSDRSIEGPAWLDTIDTSKPVIYVTQGTFDTDQSKLIRPSIEALAGMDATIIATSGRKGKEVILDKAYDNVFTADFLPYDKLLPKIDLVITNAGYGTVQNCLREGIPIIASGKTEEKAETSARIGYFGVGINLKSERPSQKAIKTAVQKILTDKRYKSKADEYAEKMKEYDSISIIMEEIDKLLSAAAS